MTTCWAGFCRVIKIPVLSSATKSYMLAHVHLPSLVAEKCALSHWSETSALSLTKIYLRMLVTQTVLRSGQSTSKGTKSPEARWTDTWLWLWRWFRWPLPSISLHPWWPRRESAMQGKPMALISTLWVHTRWPGHVQMREEGDEREGEQLKNRVLFPLSCPPWAKSLRKLFLFCSALPPPPASESPPFFINPPLQTHMLEENPFVGYPEAVFHSLIDAQTNTAKVIGSTSQTSFKQTCF